ncbi:cytochrome c oxidase accessory protein CcoG [Pacificimonas flava]|uniref:Cytochrome c oxidase accessory protein CcoG n=2 Tax=Pacificimonas TaxID=1960290 RepID=A0A219B0P8_9SPHN|nr:MULTISPECIES: cytochrome c oxidase accessory protein CcoG [Pacificimonas]MBZ6379640.1 cytochrome c oxidase accessory protein CcoG [Pacificimonas aurantium]OWV31891.1 cytochrome c oxidase accessory protein CcoG [Pacificimonas flava]
MSAPDILEDPPLQLYEKRKSVFPQKIDGTFRRLKWAIMAVTLTIYYVTPWIRWDRGPYAPDQAVLVDLANRRFFMFGIEIWPHEFYYVVGLLVMAGIGLFLVTSAVGRAWCGYACPQTVWTDLFQHIERWVDGDRNAQIRLQKAPWGPAKIARRLFKWSIWLVIAMATGGAWIFYFADAPTLARDFVTGEAAPVAYGTVFVLTMTTFVLGGFMREQVCIYMCPWPRIQSAMLDEKSLIVTYKDWRGEPRAKGLKKQRGPDELWGDCIDCLQCVSVCPTGIDIREGPQIGCITCALCIDACDRVMDKIDRPRGLIDYTTLEQQQLEEQGKEAPPAWRYLVRPRTLIYLTLWAAIGLAMLFAVGTRSRIDIGALQDRNPPYVQLADGAVRNGYTVKLRNMQARPREMRVSLVGLEGGVLWTSEGSRELADRDVVTTVPADSVQALRVFVAAPGEGAEREAFGLAVEALDDEGGADSDEIYFDRPETRR